MATPDVLHTPREQCHKQHTIVWGHCRCTVWPLVAPEAWMMGVGRCDRCRTSPEGRYDTEAEAIEVFRQERGREPRRMHEAA